MAEIDVLLLGLIPLEWGELISLLNEFYLSFSQLAAASGGRLLYCTDVLAGHVRVARTGVRVLRGN